MAQLDSQIRNRNKETPQTRRAQVQQASATPTINTPPCPSQHAPSSKGTSNNPNRVTPSTTIPRTKIRMREYRERKGTQKVDKCVTRRERERQREVWTKQKNRAEKQTKVDVVANAERRTFSEASGQIQKGITEKQWSHQHTLQ